MSKTRKKIIQSSSFNLLNSFFGLVLGIINTYFIARLIAPEEWGFLLLSLSFINTTLYFCNFFPPAVGDTIQYYIPYLLSSKGNETNEIRNFLRHVYKVRLFSIIVIYILLLIVIFFFGFDKFLFEIILIVSPLVFCNNITDLNGSILLSFQKFKRFFFINIVNISIIAVCTSFFFIFELENHLTLIAYAYLFGSIIACFFSIALTMPLIPHKKEKEIKINLSDKKKIYTIQMKYGIYLIIAGIISQISALTINLIFLNLGFVMFITYISICENSVTLAQNFSGSHRGSYISIFSELYYQKDITTFKSVFYQFNKFLMLFLCIIIEIMFFFMELYIITIYSEIYLIILIVIQLYLFTTFSRLIIRNLLLISNATNNTKINLELVVFQSILTLTATIVGLLFFNFFILIFFYVISSFLVTFFTVYIVNRRLSINIRLLVLYKPFLLFMISFLIFLPISYFINIQIVLDNIFFNLFVKSLIKSMIFFLIFYIIIFLSKFLKKEEFNQIIAITPILNSKNKIIQKFKKLIEHFLPS